MAKKGWQRSGIIPIIWATAFFYAPLAQALGLGRLTVESGLGQPLRAEIALFAFHASDLHSVRAKLASGAEFAAAGIRKSRTLRTISCDIQRKASGRYVVLLQSPQPIDVPFLHFLLALTSASGSLLHEYTALLNPASGVTTLGATAVTQAMPLPIARPAVAQSVRQEPTQSKATTRAKVKAKAATQVVRPGETLWVVALHATPSAHAMAQTLAALLRSNPRAFLHRNVNELRAGAILKIPGRREILAMPATRAASWLATQDAAWAHYKARLARSPVKTAGTSHGISGSVHSVRVLPSTREALKIEPAQIKGGVLAGSGKVSATPSRRSLVTRMSQLQKELQKTRHLMVLENQELALLQNRARMQSVNHPVVAGAIHQVGVPTTKITKITKITKPLASIKGKPLIPKHVFVPTPIPPVAPAPSFFAMLMSSEHLPIFGALLTILLGGGILWSRRRHRTMAEFEESILSGGGLNSEGQMPDTAGLPKTPEVSFLSEFSQGGNVGAMHADEVDPLAEADVYLAYGRDEQAEEILKEAVAKDGARIELKLKLLEIYFQRNDTKTFEIVAEEIYAASSGQGAAWQKVEEMGRKLDPGNPLFKRGAGAKGPQGMSVDEDVPRSSGLGDRIDFAAVARELDEVSTPRVAAPVAKKGEDEGLDWIDTGLNAAKGAPSGALTADDDALDFSLDLGNGPGLLGEESGGSKPVTSSAVGTESLDFQWDSAASSAPKNPDTNEEFAIQFDDEDISNLTTADLQIADPGSSREKGSSDRLFDISGDISGEGSGEGAGLTLEAVGNGADSDAIETKLDLARAYLEMGDGEGARGILDEVRSEGNQAQRALADTLVASIA